MTLKLLSLIICTLFLIQCKTESSSNSKDKEAIINVDDSGKITVRSNGYKFQTKEAEKLNSLAIKKVKSNKAEEALEYLMKAKELEPDNPVIVSNIGLVYQRQLKFDKAVESMKKAIALSDSTYLPATVNLANIYLDKRQFLESKKHSEWALLKIDDLPTKGGIYLNLILADVHLNNCKEALAHLEHLKEIVKITGQNQFLKAGEKEAENCKLALRFLENRH